MLLGDFPFEEAWREDTTQMIWYVCFAFIVFFLLVNMFLAIVVEAFLVVKQRNEDSHVELSLLADLYCVTINPLLRRYYGWPSHAAIIKQLYGHGHAGLPITMKELVLRLEMSTDSAHAWLWHYYRMLGDAVLPAKTQEKMLASRDDKNNISVIQSLMEAEVEDHGEDYLEAVVTIQRVVRSYLLRKKARKLQDQVYRSRMEGKTNRMEKKINALEASVKTIEKCVLQMVESSLGKNSVPAQEAAMTTGSKLAKVIQTPTPSFFRPELAPTQAEVECPLCYGAGCDKCDPTGSEDQEAARRNEMTAGSVATPAAGSVAWSDHFGPSSGPLAKVPEPPPSPAVVVRV
jgi:hypothetical protein